MNRLIATYRLTAAPGDIEATARRIAFEQTVELPEALVTDPDIVERIVGRVEDIRPDSDAPDGYFASISYSGALARHHLSQLVNLLFGNASIYDAVRLVDIELPPDLLEHYAGPAFGVAGLRRLLGVHGRPLLATALKPQGSPVERLAGMAHAFALGGGDIVKDDQNLVDDFEAFKHRVTACRQAVDEANQQTGRRCLYFPHVSARLQELDRYLDFVALEGLSGILACPMVMGLETMHSVAQRYDLAIMAHPALSGSFTNGTAHGIAHEVLLGTLFRLAGADISVYPNFGGRFGFTRSQCLEIRDRLGARLSTIAPSWPCPAGGMGYERLPDLCADYREDAVFLIGGALLGHSRDIAESTRVFLGEMRAHFEERLETPGGKPETDAQRAEIRQHFPFQPGFQWAERPSSPYKDASDAAYQGVRRVELVGKHGERTRTDLRYFEVEPGGFSSHERHLHTHIIIGARGDGVLLLDGRRIEIRAMDVAYIEPLQSHQLLNETADPFGFFCVVDHDRDRPMKV